MRIKVLWRGSAIGADDFEYRPGHVFVYDPACEDYDWLVVYDEMPSADIGTFKKGCEKLLCPKECTILATEEPISIKRYSKAYTRQFGHLLPVAYRQKLPGIRFSGPAAEKEDHFRHKLFEENALYKTCREIRTGGKAVPCHTGDGLVRQRGESFREKV